MLQIAGVDTAAECVYESLLSGPASVSRLCDCTLLPPGRVRSALRLLESLGLVGRDATEKACYTAVAPDIALDLLLLKHEEQLKRARARAQELGERFRQAVAAHDPAQLVEVVTGREAILQRTDQIVRAARKVIRCLDAPPYQDGGVAVNEAEMAFLARGGIARVVYARDGLLDRLATIEQYLTAGEHARVLPTVPTKLVLVDDRLAWVPLRSGSEPSPSFVIIHKSALLDAMSSLFETLWRLAMPLDLVGPDAEPSDEVTPDDRRLLALLATGMPDQAISRQMRMSYRTVQRRIHGLMAQLDVQTRFQLGVHASRRGWIAVPGQDA